MIAKYYNIEKFSFQGFKFKKVNKRVNPAIFCVRLLFKIYYLLSRVEVLLILDQHIIEKKFIIRLCSGCKFYFKFILHNL